MVNNGSGCANPETWLSFAKSCPEILLCEVTASECRGRARGGSASRRRRDWDDGIAGYFKAKHPRLRLTVSKDETSETCRTFESHAKHAGFRRGRIQQQNESRLPSSTTCSCGLAAIRAPGAEDCHSAFAAEADALPQPVLQPSPRAPRLRANEGGMLKRSSKGTATDHATDGMTQYALRSNWRPA